LRFLNSLTLSMSVTYSKPTIDARHLRLADLGTQWKILLSAQRNHESRPIGHVLLSLSSSLRRRPLYVTVALTPTGVAPMPIDSTGSTDLINPAKAFHPIHLFSTRRKLDKGTGMINHTMRALLRDIPPFLLSQGSSFYRWSTSFHILGPFPYQRNRSRTLRRNTASVL